MDAIIEKTSKDDSDIFDLDEVVALDPVPAETRPPRKKEGPALTGKAPDGRGWSEAYRNLGKYAFFYHSGSFTESKTYPGKFGALAAPLYRLLQKGHHDVKLTADELSRITLWLDCNSDFYGTYEKLPAQARGEIVTPVLR
jgi:hypothetical protein